MIREKRRNDKNLVIDQFYFLGDRETQTHCAKTRILVQNSKVASETSNSLKIGEMTSVQGLKLTSNDFSGLKKPQNW